MSRSIDDMMVSDRDVLAVIQQSIHLWLGSAIKSLASTPGNGEISPFLPVVGIGGHGKPIQDPQATDESQWVNYLPSKAPSLPPPTRIPDSPSVEFDITRALGRRRLISVRDANQICDDVFSRCQKVVTARLSLLQMKPNGVGAIKATRYRAWNAKGLASDEWTEAFRRAAKNNFLKYRYSPVRRRKRQVVTTRSKKAQKAKPYQWFQFSGQPAVRYPPGRPPLTEAEWMRRYRARRAKRNKTKRKATHTMKAPKCKYPRPSKPLPPRPKQ